MAKALLIDVTQCIGCHNCESACKTVNNLPEAVDATLTDKTWTHLDERGGRYVRRLCMHCVEPTCVSVCPVGALHKTPEGPVAYAAEKCMGCRYCMMACPFQIPRYEWNARVPLVRKCIMCADRVAAGESTACAAACPTGATTFGDRDALIQEARKRITEAPDKYVQAIYGEHEVGGTSVMYLSDVPFEQLGLPTLVPKQPLPALTYEVLSKIPNFVVVGGAFLFGVWWIINRRMDLAEQPGPAAVVH